MSDQTYSRTEIDLLTKPITARLEDIASDIKEVRADVKKQNDNLIQHSQDIANLYKVVSQNSGNIAALQKLKEQEVDQEVQSARLLRERLMWALVVSVIFILGFVGIINVDFIKTIL